MARACGWMARPSSSAPITKAISVADWPKSNKSGETMMAGPAIVSITA